MPYDPVERMRWLENEKQERIRAVERFGSRPKGFGETRRGGGKEWATVVVAAFDTHGLGRATADWVCEGEDDQETLAKAVLSLPLQEFDAAFNPTRGAGGGKIVLLEGTYHLSGPFIAQNPDPAGADPWSVHVQGMGGATVIKHSGTGPAIQVTGDGSGISHLWVQEAGGDAIYNSSSNGFIYACQAATRLNNEGTILGRGIVSTGSRASIIGCWVYGTVGNGIEVNGSESKVIGCDVYQCDGKGIYTTGGYTFHSQCRVQSVGGKGIHTTGSRGIISGCVVASPGTDEEGIRCDGGMSITDCYVESSGGGSAFAIRQGSSPAIVSNCRIVDAVAGGVYAGSSDNVIVGNHVDGSGIGNGIQTDSSDTHVVANRVQGFEVGIYSFGGNIADNRVDAGRHGVHVRGNTDASVTNNRVFGGWETTDTYDGIRIEGDRHNVQGNMVRSSDFKYGINVLAGATDNLVTNNDLLNSGVTGSFNDAGTGTVTTAGNRL